MNKIVLIGASGFVGQAILKEALSRGHQVIAVVRHPEKITVSNPKLTIERADVSNPGVLREISKGADAVISSYNPGWENPNIYDDTLSVNTTILNEVKYSGVTRLLVVGGAGSLFVSPGIRLMDTGAIPEAFMPGVRSLAKFYLEILSQEKELDWVFFSPAGMFVPGKRTGIFRLGKDDLVADNEGKSTISVEDYAVAMVNEAETEKHHRERFTIGY